MTYHTAKYFFARDAARISKLRKEHPKWERKDCVAELNKRWRKVPKREKEKYRKMSKDSEEVEESAQLDNQEVSASFREEIIPSPTPIPKTQTVTQDEEDICSVCYESTWLTSTPCNHPICVGCLLKLRKKECPMCRLDLTESFPETAREDFYEDSHSYFCSITNTWYEIRIRRD